MLWTACDQYFQSNKRCATSTERSRFTLLTRFWLGEGIYISHFFWKSTTQQFCLAFLIVSPGIHIQQVTIKICMWREGDLIDSSQSEVSKQGICSSFGAEQTRCCHSLKVGNACKAMRTCWRLCSCSRCFGKSGRGFSSIDWSCISTLSKICIRELKANAICLGPLTSMRLYTDSIVEFGWLE